MFARLLYPRTGSLTGVLERCLSLKQLVQLNAVKPQRSMPFILSDAQVRLSLGSSLALLITSSLLCRSAVQCSFLSAFGTAVWCSQSAMFTTARSVQCTDTDLAALY